MPQYLSYRYALRLKPAQERTLRRWAGQLRWVWNEAIREQERRHKAGEKFARFYAMCHWLTTWRSDSRSQWLALGPISPQQQVLRRLDAAYQLFFQNVAAGRNPGHPRFKGHGDDPALKFADRSKIRLDAANQRVQLPKLGWLRFRLSRPLQGDLRNVSLSRDGDKWYISIEMEQPESLRVVDAMPSLGIDLGVTHFATTSTQDRVVRFIDPLDARKRAETRLRRYQRAISRRKKGSANRRKAVRRYANLHRRIRQQRLAWLHERTTELAREHTVVAVEDLDVASLTRSARGTVDRPGINVRAKASLNQVILDQGWGRFRVLLEYKLKLRGGQLVAVPPRFTSQMCSACGHVDAASRTTRDKFQCVACAHEAHADANAAFNILQLGRKLWEAQLAAGERPAAGHAAAACGGPIERRKRICAESDGPMKQEPTEAITRSSPGA